MSPSIFHCSSNIKKKQTKIKVKWYFEGFLFLCLTRCFWFFSPIFFSTFLLFCWVFFTLRQPFPGHPPLQAAPGYPSPFPPSARGRFPVPSSCSSVPSSSSHSLIYGLYLSLSHLCSLHSWNSSGGAEGHQEGFPASMGYSRGHQGAPQLIHPLPRGLGKEGGSPGGEGNTRVTPCPGDVLLPPAHPKISSVSVSEAGSPLGWG